MHLSKITVFKNFLFLFILSFLITSCEPEEVPVIDDQPTQQFENIVGETGDQAETTQEKKG